jgi:NADPH:quinone reductase-like Zn-dependent oxidoreductase
VSALGRDSVDVVIDNVGGEAYPKMLEVFKRDGHYVTSGAIGRPIVELDLRTMYLKDQTLFGCTAWDEPA